MLYEFAVEPSCLDSWQTFRYLIEKFGVSHGRLISRFPKDWIRKVMENCSCGSFTFAGGRTLRIITTTTIAAIGARPLATRLPAVCPKSNSPRLIANGGGGASIARAIPRWRKPAGCRRSAPTIRPPRRNRRRNPDNRHAAMPSDHSQKRLQSGAGLCVAAQG